jgi:NTP pyrophosphatase (non-canonical NTP hydrolase)
MPSRSQTSSETEHILALLTNCRDLAVRQQISESRDVLRAVGIAAKGLGIDGEEIFKQLDDAIVSKPWQVLEEEFFRAAKAIKAIQGKK